MARPFHPQPTIRPLRVVFAACCGVALTAGTLAACSQGQHPASPDQQSAGSAASAPSAAPASSSAKDAAGVKFATYNASLNRKKEGQLAEDLATPENEQAKVIAKIIQSENPDVMVINEFDFDAEGKSLDLFRKSYLEVPQGDQQPVKYDYAFSAPVNTGVDSGLDLDHNGKKGEANDAWGFGQFPGQYGMVVLSKYPLKQDQVRTFQNLKWSAMPGNLMPRDYYPQDIADQLRLSSKSHWDLPVDIDGKDVHLLVSHPTPPSFDGPEHRNGRRNSDEIRLTSDYIAGGDRAEYIVDDRGAKGGLKEGASYVVFGDQNSDPNDGGAGYPGVKQLLSAPRIQDPAPRSAGAEAAGKQPGMESHKTPVAQDTADFSDPKPGNLRADYVLPSQDLRVNGSHVVWPAPGQPLSELMDPKTSSDHRMVVLEVAKP